MMKGFTRREVGIGAAVFFIPGCTGLSTPSPEEAREEAIEVDYQTLFRNVSDYEGEIIHYPRVNVTDIGEIDGETIYILSVPGGGWGDTRELFTHWDGDPMSRNDEIEVWAQVLGKETYTSMTGEVTVPEIQLIDFELLSTG